MKDEYRISVSGSTWMGSGMGSIRTALHELFSEAQDRITIVTYSISYQQDIIEHIRKALQRGIKITLIVNRFNRQHTSIKKTLLKFLKQYPDLIDIYTFDPGDQQADLHAKIVISDNSRALIGSANLSHRGLYDNHEFSILVSGRSASDIYNAVNRLLKSVYIHSL